MGKAALIKDVSISKGEIVHASANFYFPSGQSLDHVFIMDIESKSALEGKVSWNPSVGSRLYLFGDDGYLRFNRGKMGNYEDVSQSKVAMPRDQWVKIDWDMKLGIGNQGQTDISINGQKVISYTGTNWPDPDMAKQVSWTYNDTYVLDRLKVGITANNGPNTVSVYVDDVQLTHDFGGTTSTSTGSTTSVQGMLLKGTTGDNTLNGGSGDDSIFGYAGRDKLYGSGGNDTIYGNEDNDEAHGGAGTDLVDGGDGNDKLYGEDGTDTLKGGAGDDLIYGGSHYDKLYGGSGKDTIDGGTGDDLLVGNVGADRFVFGPGFGKDTIQDFSKGDGDVIDLHGLGFTSVDGALAVATVKTDASGTLISFDSENSIYLTGISQIDNTFFVV